MPHCLRLLTVGATKLPGEAVCHILTAITVRPLLTHLATQALIQQGLAKQVLEPKRRVLFLDTSALPGACECQAGDQLSNPAEADMIMRIVESLQGAGIQTGSIGVISPYRSQVSSNVYIAAISSHPAGVRLQHVCYSV